MSNDPPRYLHKFLIPGYLLTIFGCALANFGRMAASGVVKVAMYSVAVLLVVPGGVLLWIGIRQTRELKQRITEKRCFNCGYDLRATPDRCPECGTPRQGNAVN